MRCSIINLAVTTMLLSLVAVPATAQDIIATVPEYHMGTTFILNYQKENYYPRKSSEWTRELKYHGPGKTAQLAYDFGEFDVTPHLSVLKKTWGRDGSSVKNVLFPLFHGKTWKYERSYKAGKGCGSMTEYMTATVDDEMTLVTTVSGEEFEGVWIRHDGHWESTNMCGRGRVGVRERGNLYVPELGFYVKTYSRMYLATMNGRQGGLYREIVGEMVDFAIMTPTQ